MSWTRALLLTAALASSACAGDARTSASRSPKARLDPVARDVMQFRYRVNLGQAVKSPNPQQSASVVVDEANDRFYSAGTTGSLCARDLATGASIWCTPLGGEHRGRPLLTAQGDLLIAQDNGELRWYDAKTLKSGKDLKPRWRFKSPGLVHEPPVLANGFVYLASSRNEVIALDARTGQWRWTYEREMPKDFSILGRAGLLYQKKPGASDLAGGVLYTGFDDGQVAAIDAISGQALWMESLVPASVKSLADVDTTPILFAPSNTLVVAGAAEGIVGLDPKDGSRRWRVKGRDFNRITQVDQERFLAASPTEGLWLLNHKGQVLWQSRFDRGTTTAPTVFRDVIFLGHDTLGLLVFELATGDLLSNVDLGSGTRSMPVVAARRAMMLYITHHAWLLGFDLWDGSQTPQASLSTESAM